MRFIITPLVFLLLREASLSTQLCYDDVELLLKRELENQKKTELYSNYKLERIKGLVREGANPNNIADLKTGHTPLLLAAKEGGR